MSDNIIKLPPGVIPFDETYILYKDGDIIGAICCILALAPILILQSYLTWLIINRDIESIVIVVGQLGNEVLNKILKRIFKHTRPMHEDGINLVLSESTLSFGMPSAHCQFMGFFTSYIIINLWLRWGKKYNILKVDKIVYSGLTILLSIVVCVSRWYLQYHHWDQIIIGFQVGLLVGLLYYLATLIAIFPLIKRVYKNSTIRMILNRLHIFV